MNKCVQLLINDQIAMIQAVLVLYLPPLFLMGGFMISAAVILLIYRSIYIDFININHAFDCSIL